MPESEENIPSRDILLGYLAEQNEFSMNVEQKYLVITKDKLYIHLNKTVDNLKKRHVWTTPLSIFISLLIVILTANFKDIIFTASAWKAMFIIGACLMFIWLVIALIRCSPSETISQIIERMSRDPDK